MKEQSIPVPAYAWSLAAVTTATLVIAAVNQVVIIENISMVYLVAVIGVALRYGKGPAILASVLGFAGYNFFFVEPLYTPSVAEESEWLALLLFLGSAFVTGQLVAAQRTRARESEQRERETALLYDLVRLVVSVDQQAGLQAVVARLRQELGLRAAGIVIETQGEEPLFILDGEPRAIEVLKTVTVAPSRLLVEGSKPTATARGGIGRWVRAVPPRAAASLRAGMPRPEVVPLKAGEKRLGSLVVVRDQAMTGRDLNEERVLAAVAAQVGSVIQMERLRREAMETAALRREDELKTALLNAVSHDLKTPLASIIAAAGSLQQTDIDWTIEERREFADAIEAEAQRLDRLVTNLLDLSRLESGNLKPETDWYDLPALLEEVIARLKPLVGEREVTIRIDDDIPPLRLDYIEIDEVLTNLIENAIKYSPESTPVAITVEKQPDRVLVSVADRGPGLDRTARSHVFEPFYRVPGTGKKGTGLGLAVARGLVEAHGGSIWVADNPGGGSVFTFTLPAGPSRATAAATSR